MAIQPGAQKIHIAVLECCRFPADVVAVRGQFGDIFESWLRKSLDLFNKKRPLGNPLEIAVTSWDVEHGEYPPSLDGIDALIVTGSPSSACDDEPWIKVLEKYIQDIYTQARVKIFGGCFGHQIISRVLLGPHGVSVSRSPQGWEIGVHDIALTAEFTAHFPSLLDNKTLPCQFLHVDQVVVPKDTLPQGWIRIGSSRLCDVQGLYKPGHILTYQSHPELDRFVMESVVRSFEPSGILNVDEVEEAVQLIDRDDLALVAGEVVLEFFSREK